MTDRHWQDLKKVIEGEVLTPAPVGFIIDSPWLPNWYGIRILDYFTSDELWLKANLKVHEDFPEVMFLPGFWSELGMCGEPSAFGARSSFPPDEFPHARPVIRDPEEIDRIEVPHPEKDGLGPFIINRLRINRSAMEDAGHKIRFSVSRGPLNIASYLMGTTELMMAMLTHPEHIQDLLKKITRYLVEFHNYQSSLFGTIDGILVLDDIIGFISGEQFAEFGLPFFKELFDRPLSIRFLHNDASCMESIGYLPEMGVNLFNMGFDTDLNQLKELTGNRVTMLGNIPPRDVLARGTPGEVRSAVKQLQLQLKDPSRVIYSCGGGMPPRVPSDNLKAFVAAAREKPV